MYVQFPSPVIIAVACNVSSRHVVHAAKSHMLGNLLFWMFLQFTDEHGEVCPANWTTGAKTMKGDPVKSQEYFKTLSS